MSAIATDVFPSDDHADASAKPKSGFASAPANRCGLITYYARSAKAILVLLLIVIPAVGIPVFMEESGQTVDLPPMIVTSAIVLMVIAIIGLSLYYLRLTIHRLHDLDLSAWFVLLLFVPVIGIIFGMYISLVPGKEAENRFGAWLAPTSSDKVFCAIGVVIMLAILCLTLWVHLSGIQL